MSDYDENDDGGDFPGIFYGGSALSDTDGQESGDDYSVYDGNAEHDEWVDCLYSNSTGEGYFADDEACRPRPVPRQQPARRRNAGSGRRPAQPRRGQSRGDDNGFVYKAVILAIAVFAAAVALALCI